jgi:hypothetical protein
VPVRSQLSATLLWWTLKWVHPRTKERVIVHSLNNFDARTNHDETQTHNTRHGPNLGETTTFPLIIFYVHGHRASTQMSFCLRFPSGSPKIPKIGTFTILKHITLCANLQLRWGLKQSCRPCQELSNGMWHAIYTQGNQGDSRLLVVRSQINNLTLDLFLGHNLCLKNPNGSCKPILDIYFSRTFQWYKKLLNPMSFDPCNYPLKNWKSIRIPTPKVGAHLRVRGSFSHTLLHSLEHEMWLSSSLLASTFVNPCLGHEPKVKNAT